MNWYPPWGVASSREKFTLMGTFICDISMPIWIISSLWRTVWQNKREAWKYTTKNSSYPGCCPVGSNSARNSPIKQYFLCFKFYFSPVPIRWNRKLEFNSCLPCRKFRVKLDLPRSTNHGPRLKSEKSATDGVAYGGKAIRNLPPLAWGKTHIFFPTHFSCLCDWCRKSPFLEMHFQVKSGIPRSFVSVSFPAHKDSVAFVAKLSGTDSCNHLSSKLN